MKRTLNTIFFGGAVWGVLGLALSANANLVVNGSFESPLGGGIIPPTAIPGWTASIVNSGAGIYTAGQYNGANVTDGNQAFDLGMAGWADGNSISQLLPTVAGQQYRLTFDWGSQYANGMTAYVSVGNLNVSITDTVRGDGNPNPPWNTGMVAWIVHSADYVFTASGNDTLMFWEPPTPDDRWGLALDNVRVTAVPDAGSTFALMVLGLGALIPFYRKNR
jgi:hypothetical protein